MDGRALALTPDHLARAFRVVPETHTASTFTRADDAHFKALVERLMDERPEGPLRVFAYGSLIWKPSFAPAARHRAVARGWHRQFCIEIRGFRGTPEAPGLMLALMPGGRCAGLALDVPVAEEVTLLDALLRREVPFFESVENLRWITLDMAEGPVRSLVFYAGPTDPNVRRSLPLEDAARQIARACGYAGSMAEYLRNTVTSLLENGINDRNLWRLQELVAAEIDRIHPA
jgi:cation transport protein ChaC